MSITILIRNWITNVLIFLALMLIIGCSMTKSLTSKTFTIKSIKEMMEENHKNLRIAKELTFNLIDAKLLCFGITLNQMRPKNDL